MTEIKLISRQMQEDSVCCRVLAFLNNSIPSKKMQVVSAWHQSRVRESGWNEGLGQETAKIHYNRVGKGVGDSCSFGAYLAKKGKNTVSMTPTMASM